MHLLKEMGAGGWAAVQQPGFRSSYTKQDTHNEEMEKRGGRLHLLLRVEQIETQTESSSTSKAKGKLLQPGREHKWQLQ